MVLPVAAVASLMPLAVTSPHRFPYAADSCWPPRTSRSPWSPTRCSSSPPLQALLLTGLEKRLRRRLPDPGAAGLPPLLTLERFLFRLIAVGFVLLTLTLGSGMLFSEQIFGRAVRPTHKSILSLLAWLTFGALLWGRWRYGWRGRLALYWILAGTALLLLGYLGSKFVSQILLGR